MLSIIYSERDEMEILMKALKILAVPFTFLLLTHAQATTKTIPLKHGAVKIDVPSTWQEAKNLFGVELTLLGPSERENRPVVTVNSTSFSDFKFDAEALKKGSGDESYQEGRKKWLSKYEGEVKQFFPYESKKLMGGKVTDHVLGFQYTIGQNEFIEQAHYIQCPKNLYHIKTLVLAVDKEKYQSAIDNLINRFECVE